MTIECPECGEAVKQTTSKHITCKNCNTEIVSHASPQVLRTHRARAEATPRRRGPWRNQNY